jgi:hypothetical protein
MQHTPRNLAVIERDGSVFQDLVGLVAFAGEHDNIAGAGSFER